MEVGRYNPSFMFEEGNFAELSITNTTPKVTDDKFSPNGSMLGQMTNTSMSVKMKINDRLSFGLQHFDAARIDLSYAGNGGPFTKSADPYKTQVAVTEDAVKKDGATQTAIGNYLNANGLSQTQANINIAIAKDAATQKAISDYYAGLSTSQIQGILLTKYTSAANIPLSKEPFVDLSFKSTVLALTYKVNDRVDIFGGIKYSVGSATGNVLIDPHGDLAASEAAGTAPVVGVSYSIPDIALRVTATYQGKTETSHSTTRTYDGVKSELANTKAALPESFTLDFQSGIATDTLLFGSIHRVKWGDAQIFFNGSSKPKSTWTDSTSYSLGVGRKLNESWSVSASYNYEEGTESSGTSLLSTTNGVRGVTLGARYTMDKMVVSLGVNYSEFGDKTVTAAPLGTGKFTNNSMTSIGLKIGYRF
ncbi:MAG: hypothetical protein ACO39Z_09160 [Paracoccaceae bacterium]